MLIAFFYYMINNFLNKEGKYKSMLKNVTNVLKPGDIKIVSTYERGKAYVPSLEDKLCTIFTIGILNNRFYEDYETAVNDLDSIFRQALKECPYLATQYAVYSAETLRMKLIPTIWLVYISTLEDKTLFKKSFYRIIGKNVKMLHDFVDICRLTNIRPGGHMQQKIRGTNRGLGSALKKEIINWLNITLNDYNVTRFTNKLEDICRLVRIKDTADNEKYLKYIFRPEDGERRLTFERARLLDETIKILSSKHSNDDFKTALMNIDKGKLQMDEIKMTFGSLSKDELQQVYKHFVPNLKYAALITNLVAIERAFATSTGNKEYHRSQTVYETNIPKDLEQIVANKIRSINDFEASGLFFLRLYAASKMIKTTSWINALSEVFQEVAKTAFKDIPNDIKVRVSADTSGSMDHSLNGAYIKAVDVASYFTAAIALSVPNANAYATATITKQVPLRGDNITVIADDIKNTNVGYGTNFETLLEGYKGENIVLIITDTQQNSDVERKWKMLQKPDNAKFIVWDVVGYYNNNVISKESSILYIRGYSDYVMSVITNLILGKAGQKEIVHSVLL